MSYVETYRRHTTKKAMDVRDRQHIARAHTPANQTLREWNASFGDKRCDVNKIIDRKEKAADWHTKFKRRNKMTIKMLEVETSVQSECQRPTVQQAAMFEKVKKRKKSITQVTRTNESDARAQCPPHTHTQIGRLTARVLAAKWPSACFRTFEQENGWLCKNEHTHIHTHTTRE